MIEVRWLRLEIVVRAGVATSRSRATRSEQVDVSATHPDAVSASEEERVHEVSVEPRR